MTALYGVIGDPIAHSLSPVIHRGWMRDYGLAADYRAFQVQTGAAREGLEALAREGVKGLNVTLPHKRAVLDLCTEQSELVRALGAANTLSRTADGGWRADNTDQDGFLNDFQATVQSPLNGLQVLLLGAGGSAAAVAKALVSAGAAPVIANRTPEKAVALCEALGLPRHRALALGEIGAIMDNVQVVVSSLAIGQAVGTLEIGPGNGRLFHDLSYGPKAAPMADYAIQLGWRAHSGLGMLVGQAALSFQIWHGIWPDTDRAMARCTTALEMTA